MSQTIKGVISMGGTLPDYKQIHRTDHEANTAFDNILGYLPTTFTNLADQTVAPRVAGHVKGDPNL